MRKPPELLEEIASVRRTRQREYAALVMRVHEGSAKKKDAESVDAMLQRCSVSYSQFCRDVTTGKVTDLVTVDSELAGFLREYEKSVREKQQAAAIEKDRAETTAANARATLADITEKRRKFETPELRQEAEQHLRNAIARSEHVCGEQGKCAADLDSELQAADTRLSAALAAV